MKKISLCSKAIQPQRRWASRNPSSMTSGDLQTDTYLAECYTSRNPLKRLVIGPFGRTFLPKSTLSIVFLSGSAWALVDYFGQKWEMEAAIGWAKENDAHRARLQKEASISNGQASPPLVQQQPKLIINTINPVQIGVAGLYGALVMGLGGRYWYPFMDRLARKALPPGHSRHSLTMVKLSAEFCIWYPFTLMSYWMLIGSSVYDQPVLDLFSEATGQLIPTIVTEAPIWFPAQYINFRFFPPLLHVYYVCVVAFVENMLMNYVKAEALGDEEFRQNTSFSK